MTLSPISSTQPALELDLWVDVINSLPAAVAIEIPPSETWKTWFSQWLTQLAPVSSPISHYEISLLLTDDATIQQLNSTYRHQDKATDVLAFAAQEVDIPSAAAIYQTTPLPLGDVIISVETAQHQRHSADYSLPQELAWLAAHGLLHLLGWDHPDDNSLQMMLNQQHDLLKQAELLQ